MLIIRDFQVPETVPVRMTGLGECMPSMWYTEADIPFKEYVKGVLPNEWFPFWDEESLKAGAVAVKMFAMSKIESGGILWDCTWSQVYNPAKRTLATDKAVDETWDWFLFNESGDSLRTFFNANSAGCETQGEDCMSQVGSQELAEEGLSWDEILLKYYTGILVQNKGDWYEDTKSNSTDCDGDLDILDCYRMYLKR